MTAISATAAARPSSPAPISTSCRPRSASGWPSASATPGTDESARHMRSAAVEPIELIELVAEDSLGDHDADAIARGRVIEYGRYAVGQRRGIAIMQPLDQAAPFLFLGRIGHDLFPLSPSTIRPSPRSAAARPYVRLWAKCRAKRQIRRLIHPLLTIRPFPLDEAKIYLH